MRTLLAVTVMAITCCSSLPAAHADDAFSAPSYRAADDLDGVYLMLGPLGAMSYHDRAWQSTFGGQLLAVLVRERHALASLGLALGGLRYTTTESGRVWADFVLGTRILGVHGGVAMGPVLDIDRVEPARLGGQGTLWLFTGVIPYARVGAVQGRGTFVELGVQLMLPALRL